ncbi:MULTISPECIES: hypothetical protein [unclassified Streptomyces]|uniref:hypothetical protein n=1 Tax=unclassified Streptomyces TaxID=2593676 RepID=UPI0006896E15|nr:hypothetical protein [Streptomyces sp. NRRL S-241]
MNRTRTALALLAAALLLTGCASYDDHVQDCAKAVKARPAGDKTKPEACEPLKEDDYTLIVMSNVVDELGWTDEDGSVDPNKMIAPTP